MTVISAQALPIVLRQFRLDHTSNVHGIPHWSRVAANGRKLAQMLGVDNLQGVLHVVEWFAYFHDACRHNDGHDPLHGQRAAKLLWRCWEQDRLPGLSLNDVNQLMDALTFHSTGQDGKGASLAVRICWDADRLDLPRVGVLPDPARMCTPAGAALAKEIGAAHDTASRKKAFRGSRRVASYPAAIQWIVNEDDTEWLDDPNGSPSVTACLVADLFGRTTDEVTKDLRKLVGEQGPAHNSGG